MVDSEDLLKVFKKKKQVSEKIFFFKTTLDAGATGLSLLGEKNNVDLCSTFYFCLSCFVCKKGNNSILETEILCSCAVEKDP